MKTNVCELKKGGQGLTGILDEVEKASEYNGLTKKQTLRLRLLAEELTGMLPELVDRFEGSFWMENDGLKYELHVELHADEISTDMRENLISVSKSGKNAAATGIMGKIRAAAEAMFLTTSDVSVSVPFECPDLGLAYTYAWSLEQYRQQVESENRKDEHDELERSIVGKLSDDVIVGIRGKQVDIIIKKAFNGTEE